MKAGHAAVILLAITMAGCADIANQAAQQRLRAQVDEQFKTASQDCGNRFPTTTPQNVVAKVQCANGAVAITLPALGSNQDLAQTFMAERLAIAEHMQNGKITIAQGSALIQEKWSAAVSEAQRRNALAQSVAAQQQAADSAMWSAVFASSLAGSSAPAPTQNVRVQSTCMQNGNMTFCH